MNTLLTLEERRAEIIRLVKKLNKMYLDPISNQNIKLLYTDMQKPG